jgi:archaellum component FlaC
VLKRNHIEELSKAVKDLETMYNDLNNSSHAIRSEISTQNRMINAIKAKRQDW